MTDNQPITIAVSETHVNYVGSSNISTLIKYSRNQVVHSNLCFFPYVGAFCVGFTHVCDRLCVVFISY